MTTMLPKQIAHYESLQSLENDLKYYQESANAMVERVKGLESSPDPVDRANLVTAKKVLARDLRMIRLYLAEISKHKRTRPSV